MSLDHCRRWRWSVRPVRCSYLEPVPESAGL